ncbi:MAG TPA: inorganic pyrophosphatase [Candidatus Hydrogenedentes bacterium]|nr:inorganic pyrophosphatase [Candidatus Hydrogenedentota bacterium]HOS01454.1 inorganic pyrophosphatase [Candidatus Hydrogenedentota bacterium]
MHDPDVRWSMLCALFKAHPWHGVSIGGEAPDRLTAYIEMVPADSVKYELDKDSGLLRIDRPQRYSNVCPVLYGFVPQTYCGDVFAAHCAEFETRAPLQGDGDPLDICVLTERTINQGDILLRAIPIGGLRMLDGNDCDDKIIAVLDGDPSYGQWRDVGDCPTPLLDRLRHYFLTYKQSPDQKRRDTEITRVYGRDEAHDVIRHCQQDYLGAFADVASVFGRLIASKDLLPPE